MADAKPTIELVTHCYCPRGTDTYAEHLKWQWASLLHYCPRTCHVLLTICYTQQDTATALRVQAIEESAKRTAPHLSVQAMDLPPERLFRRAIGRNVAALWTNAQAIWFTDVDYLFGPGALDAVAAKVPRTAGLTIPAQVQIQVDHATGDRMIAAHRAEQFPSIDPTLFASRKQRLAIGGCQIVGGDLARRIGYLDGTRWVQPVDPMAGFRSCRCDKAWRQLNGLNSVRLSIPNVYRIRHSEDGRDYDFQGQKIGKGAW